VARRVHFLLPILALFVVLSSPVAAQKKLTASEAKDHVGETATVCGIVASARYATSTKGQPTFLNLDKPYPNQVFTVLIWGGRRSYAARVRRLGIERIPEIARENGKKGGRPSKGDRK
jgi:hypothetical protein